MKNINELEQELSNLLCPLHNKSSKITITELEDELSIKGEKCCEEYNKELMSIFKPYAIQYLKESVKKKMQDIFK